MLARRKLFQSSKYLWKTSSRMFTQDKGSHSGESHYETLGLSPSASKEQIKKAYKELSKKYHPDVSKDADAAERFKRINHAYSVLKDQDARNNYDQQQDSSSGYEKAYTSTQQYTSKKPEAETKSNGSRAAEKPQGKSIEEQLYEKIFGKTFREDPMYYYKEGNENLRKKYDEELSRLNRNTNGAGAGATAGAQTYSREFQEERDEWRQFMNDLGRDGSHQGGSSGAAAVEYPQQAAPSMDPSTLKWIGGGLALFGAISLYLVVNERSKSKSQFETVEKPLSGLDLDNIRSAHLKREEDKKEKKKADFLSSLALMKKYPRRNPNANSMLADYTIWSDLKIYSVPYTYFHGEDEQLCRTTKNFEKNRIWNAKINTYLTLALESERVFKNVFVKIDDVLKSLKETGSYEPPGVFFRYYGYIYTSIRRKPIVAENLQEHIEAGEKVISVFDLFFKYSTPILMANPEYYEIPLKHSSYVQDTTTREGLGWIGNAHINHRPVPKIVVNEGEKNVFMWRGPMPVTPIQEKYLRTWGVYYDQYTKLK